MTTPHDDDELTDQEMPLVEHLIELRRCVIHALVAYVAVFVSLLPFNHKIYQLFAWPVLSNLLPNQQMLAYQPIDIFLTPIKVCLFLALLLTMPWILYQIWRFIAPAMYRHEKRLMLPIVISATVLFYLGVLFAYFVILPLMFTFFSGIELEGVAFMPDITSYLSLSIAIFLAFGVTFEVPIITVILIRLGVVEIETLTRQRPYIVLIAFTIGMFLTPPDVFSQTLLAVPMLILFEIGIIFAKYLQKQSAEKD